MGRQVATAVGEHGVGEFGKIVGDSQAGAAGGEAGDGGAVVFVGGALGIDVALSTREVSALHAGEEICRR